VTQSISARANSVLPFFSTSDKEALETEVSCSREKSSGSVTPFILAALLTTLLASAVLSLLSNHLADSGTSLRQLGHFKHRFVNFL